MGLIVLKRLRLFALIFAVFLPDFIYFCTTVAHIHPNFIKIVDVFDLYIPKKILKDYRYTYNFCHWSA